MIEAGFVPDLVNLLSMFDQPALQFEAAWALTNIASGNALQTRAVIEVKAVPLFIQLLQSSCADVADQVNQDLTCEIWFQVFFWNFKVEIFNI